MDNKHKAVHGTGENKPHDLTVRVSICELEIQNLKYQLKYLCKPFIERQRKSSGIEHLTMDELLKTKPKTKVADKSFGRKIAGQVSKLIRGK